MAVEEKVQSTLEQNQSTHVKIDGKDYLYFGGTNYLGLAHRPELLQAFAEGFRRFGFSAGASRLTSGETDLILTLERELAAFARADAALVLPAGYMSNMSVTDAIDDLVDVWVVHKNAHGSINAAVGQSRKRVIVVENEDSDLPLKQRLDLPWDAVLGIFVEPIEAPTGSIFPLPRLLSTVTESDFVVLDEAHSFGVLGPQGLGALDHFGLKQRERLIRTGTFSKALGTSGGFVLAGQEIIERVTQRSLCFKASTALAPAICAATLEGLKIIRQDPASTLQKLRANIAFLNSALKKAGIDAQQHETVPIFYLRNSQAVAKLWEVLYEHQIYVPSVTSYFSDFCEIGLRWTVQSEHTQADLDALVDVLSKHLCR